MCKNTIYTPQQLVDKSRHRYERPLFYITAIFTVLALLIALGISVYQQETVEFLQENAVQQYRTEHPEAAKMPEKTILASLSEEERESIDMVESLHPALIMLAPLGFLLLIIYQIGKIYGGARADGIRVTREQFGDVHKIWSEMAQQLGLKNVPELYIKNGNGTLNAFATCMPGYRNFGVIYSDILERAIANQDETILRFILGHELGHVRLKHVAWWSHLLGVIGNMPGFNYILGLPLSRSREYGCDKVGFALSQDTEQRGLLMLAAGKHLYREVNPEAYHAEHIDKRSFWATISNFFGDHPNINWRIAALKQKRHGDLFWVSKK